MNSATNSDPSLLDSTGQARKIARYTLKSIMGRGASGVVYLAYDPQGRNEVVLRLNRVSSKVLDYWSQISREILEISAKIAHESTPKLLDLGILENSVYLVHEYIPGDTLEEATSSELLLNLQKLFAELMRVAEALDQAHSLGLIHSDLKPANFVINPLNSLYVLDLSMSVFRHCCGRYSDLSEESSVIGTPAYLSPEQIKDRHTDARSDLFSFAAVVFKVLTNQQPFDGHSFTEITQSILSEKEKSAYSYNPLLGNKIDPIFNKALHKDPAQRYSSACQFILALQKAISLENNRSGTTSTLNATRKLAQISPEDLNSQYNLSSVQINQENPAQEQIRSVSKHKALTDSDFIRTASHSSKRTLPSLNLKILLLLVAILAIFFIAVLILALYPRATTLVLQNDPLLSEISKNDPVSENRLLQNTAATNEKKLPEQDLVFKRAEAKAVVESIIETKPQDLILPDLLQKLQSNPLIYQDHSFIKLFRHESYLVKVSVIKKVIEAKVIDYLPQIRLSLSDADPLVRGFAVKAIGILGIESDKELLIKAIATEKQPEVKQAMTNALKRLESSVIH